MLDPLYTADEMRAAEQGHDVEELMERAGHAVAQAVLRRYPEARRIAAVCGKGANGGDGRIALRVLAESGRETAEALDGDFDLVIDALFGTGFHGEPRADAAALQPFVILARMHRWKTPCSSRARSSASTSGSTSCSRAQRNSRQRHGNSVARKHLQKPLHPNGNPRGR